MDGGREGGRERERVELSQLLKNKKNGLLIKKVPLPIPETFVGYLSTQLLINHALFQW